MRGPLRGRGPMRGLPGLRSRRLPSLQSLRRLFRLQLRLLRFLGRLPLHLLEALSIALSGRRAVTTTAGELPRCSPRFHGATRQLFRKSIAACKLTVRRESACHGSCAY